MFEPLFKRATSGAVQVWKINVEPNDDGTATIITEYGQIDKNMRVTREIIRKGKNVGKKNATTAFQQAVNEASSKWNAKRDREYYGLTVEESDNKRLFAPMLAHKWRDDEGNITSYALSVDWKDTDHLWGQPKFDGNRCRAVREGNGDVKLYSRRGDRINTCDHLVEQLDRVVPENWTLDGELYTHGVPVTTIRGLISKKQAGTENLCFIGYDHVNREEAFRERMQQLRSLQPKFGSHIMLSRTVPIRNEEELMAFQAECIANGYEGAMLRHGREGYKPDERSAQLLKVKSFHDAEFVIVGCKQGSGLYEGAAVFECVTPAGDKFDVTAPGDIPQKRWYWENHHSFIGKMMTVKYAYMTATEHPVPFHCVAKEVLT